MSNIDLARWYIIHTYSSYENVVEESLHRMIENNGLEDFIFEIVVPVEDDIVEKNGKRKLIQRKKFPGYVFLKMVMNDTVWDLVAHTRGVTGFVGPAGTATALTPEEVKRNGLEKIDIAEFDIQVGDSVRVISGALESFIGEVEDVNAEHAKLRVLVQMFGRLTPVELEFSQVEKI